ncbi:MAG: class F sortase [Actinomycetota bacterium]
MKVKIPAAEPSRIRIPSIAVDSAIIPVALRPDGAMQTPDFGIAGWYRPGPIPGNPGPAVIVAHVDSKKGPDVFFRLRELKPGNEISVSNADGAQHRFRVDSLEQTSKDQLPVERIWASTSDPVLRLLTCGGRFDRATGHYVDNVIVYASAAL